MKSEIYNPECIKKFKPVSIIITFETEEEFKSFYQLTNVANTTDIRNKIEEGGTFVEKPKIYSIPYIHATMVNLAKTIKFI